MAAGEGSIDFLGNLEHLRNQRANLVDNIEQYKLVHLIVLECLFGLRTSIPCNVQMSEAVNFHLENNGVQKEMEYINNIQWQDSAMEAILETDNGPVYFEKNRFGNIQPGKHPCIVYRNA